MAAWLAPPYSGIARAPDICTRRSPGGNPPRRMMFAACGHPNARAARRVARLCRRRHAVAVAAVVAVDHAMECRRGCSRRRGSDRPLARATSSCHRDNGRAVIAHTCRAARRCGGRRAGIRLRSMARGDAPRGSAAAGMGGRRYRARRRRRRAAAAVPARHTLRVRRRAHRHPRRRDARAPVTRVVCRGQERRNKRVGAAALRRRTLAPRRAPEAPARQRQPARLRHRSVAPGEQSAGYGLRAQGRAQREARRVRGPAFGLDRASPRTRARADRCGAAGRRVCRRDRCADHRRPAGDPGAAVARLQPDRHYASDQHLRSSRHRVRGAGRGCCLRGCPAPGLAHDARSCAQAGRAGGCGCGHGLCAAGGFAGARPADAADACRGRAGSVARSPRHRGDDLAVGARDRRRVGPVGGRHARLLAVVRQRRASAVRPRRATAVATGVLPPRALGTRAPDGCAHAGARHRGPRAADAGAVPAGLADLASGECLGDTGESPSRWCRSR